MANYMCILTVACTCLFQGVLGNEMDDISGLVAATVVGFFMLVIVVTMLALGLTWDSWYPKIQRWRGKVKIPRHIIELRKRRAAQRAASDKAILVNQNGKVPVTDQDSKSWVEGWQNGHKQYEVKDLTMNFGEEKQEVGDDFRIEAELVDDETLDLGPYKKMPDSSVVESEKNEDIDSPVYTTINRESQKSKNGGIPNHAYEETETSFSALTSDPSVVIM